MATKPDYEAYAVSLGMVPRRPDPEAESAAHDDHLSSPGSHIEPPCTACNAASLVESALDILNPDDCTISNVCRGDCGTVTFDVLSDDVGPYSCRVTVEILEA